MKTLTSTLQFPLSVATTGVIAALMLSAPARAEYRCATPEQLFQEEQRACELAKQDSPAALIHFVNRTKSVYNLYVNDYVSKSDVERWNRAKRAGTTPAHAIADSRSSSEEPSKAR